MQRLGDRKSRLLQTCRVTFSQYLAIVSRHYGYVLELPLQHCSIHLHVKCSRLFKFTVKQFSLLLKSNGKMELQGCLELTVLSSTSFLFKFFFLLSLFTVTIIINDTNITALNCLVYSLKLCHQFSHCQNSFSVFVPDSHLWFSSNRNKRQAGAAHCR